MGLSKAFQVLSLLLLTFHTTLVASRPRPEPKSAWLRNSAKRKGFPGYSKREAPSGTDCVDTQLGKLAAPKPNVWAGLTNDETASVTAWLFAQTSLNLTQTENATEWDNTIMLVELMTPNKTDVLAFLEGVVERPPTRYAHVMIDHRADENPYYADILVGPLPLQNGTNGSATWEPLTYPFTKQNNGRVRNLDADDDTLYSDWLYVVSASIKDITLELWNGTCLGLDNDTIDVWGIDPLWQDDGIIRWDTFWNYPTSDFDAETLLPLGLYFMSNVTGRDPSKWSLEGWLYNDVFYPTTDAFRAAFWSPGFERLPPNVEDTWADSDQEGTVPPADKIYPPSLVAPAGSRFRVDVEERYVKWMDFDFYLSFTRDTGLRLFNIRYKGERIIYELGLEEALAHYAGNDPVSSGTSYLDSFYGFGPYAFELVKGFDCPSYATYLNSSFYTAETTHTHLDSICLFEMDAGYPIQRHSTMNYVSSTRNIFFTVRSVSTVGNYDYMFSYQFYMDGSIHIEVRASGYIQSTYYAKNGDYGYHIHDALSGSMHDHVLHYKLDMDVLGTANTMQMTTLVATTETYPWSRGKSRNTMKLQRSFVESEDESKLFWAANGATQFSVVNTDKPNAFGEYRGYRILPSEGTIHSTVQNSSNLVNAANWAGYDLMVTKQKDSEPRSAHPFNSQDVSDPPIDFSKFFDGESLMQEDLVVWFNLGMHHIPHTGDLPNTVFTTAHSGLQIMPLNYLKGDPSRETVNMVRINYKDGVVSEVAEFGQKEPVCALDFQPIEPDLADYKGDVVIRKFPYDPSDWYYETDSIV
ncbi:membrane copper amine oxidase [Mytilinidion resinicola]|uniref:Amine oxidase n=1 Tax=Mytilinidion resinicola TaxID=574789 RepID=A0A6A6YWX1_9PEZI|nr:membrane copper amine oxidase [Mytilinidion resinicola]KAF2813058.1 membrane copper amine oxidase [Mytilinidion resinicola]